VPLHQNSEEVLLWKG